MCFSLDPIRKEKQTIFYSTLPLSFSLFVVFNFYFSLGKYVVTFNHEYQKQNHPILTNYSISSILHPNITISNLNNTEHMLLCAVVFTPYTQFVGQIIKMRLLLISVYVS